MDFDLFLEEIKKKTPKFKKTKRAESKKLKERVESAILDDKCTEIPQTNDGRRVYK